MQQLDNIKAYLLRIETEAEQEFEVWLWNVERNRSASAIEQLLRAQIKLNLTRKLVRDIWLLLADNS